MWMSRVARQGGTRAAGAVLLLAPSAAAQRGSSSAPPAEHTLRSLTEVVNVPVTVRDEDQQLVRDLKREDFVLKEDGRVQQIKYFSRTSDVPLTFGFVVDTTVCQDVQLPLEKDAMEEFVQQVMQPSDRGCDAFRRGS